MKALRNTTLSPAKRKKIIVENCWGFGMISISIISILVFIFYPLIFSLVISFQNWNPVRGGSFIGVSNYIRILKDNLFHTAMTNNFKYAFWTIIGGFVFSYSAAIMVSSLPFKGVLRFIYFIPTVCCPIMIGMIWTYLLQPQIGLVNTLLRAAGFSNPSNWLGSASTAPAILYIVVIWSGLGYWMIVFLTGILDIPDTYYEAATLDGASAWKKFIHITLPLSSPVIFFYLTMALITCWGQFDLVMTLGSTGDRNASVGTGPGNSFLLPSYLMYQTSFRSMEFGRAAAMGWALAIFIFAISFINNRLSKLWVTYDR
jgi:ABC-type sugar transport system permease subunit